VISVQEAFIKFKGRLELTQKEREDASRRQTKIREVIRRAFEIERDILTGSYSRHTKTKPLKDVDIFCIFGPGEANRRRQSPSDLLDAFRKALVPEYGDGRVSVHRRSVEVELGVQVIEDDSREQVMSFDVVPAFSIEKCYEIPDRQKGTWIKTDPEAHREMVTTANNGFSGQLVPMVKMIKKWNDVNGNPVCPPFLLEVMALQILAPPFSGGYRYEFKSFLATAASRIGEVWKDPAGFGPPVSDQMDSSKIAGARRAFEKAGISVSNALRFERENRGGDALREWRSIFGPLFPLS